MPKKMWTGNAQQRIQEAAATNATTLDLARLGLTEIPEGLRELTALQELELSANHLRKLPDWLPELSSLENLNVSGNDLSSVQILSEMQKLSYLAINGNPLEGFPRWIRSATNLKALWLGGPQFPELPHWMSELIWLRMLYMSDGELRVLPEWLQDLRGLTHIGLTKNKLRELPHWLSELENLERFFGGFNKFSQIPEPLLGLTRLRGLYLHNNRIVDLPATPSGLRNLHYLTLFDNPIRKLPGWIGELDQLKSLLLDGLKCEFPAELGDLTRLIRLRMDDCGLSEVPPWLSRLTALTYLGLSQNPFVELPAFLADLPALEDIVVVKNQIQNPPPEVCAAGTDDILGYLRAVRDTGEPQWRSRMLVVGEAAVGKTSVTKALCGLDYDPSEPQTHGVHLDPLDLSAELLASQAQLNVWDFGGQLEYRATQRFYISDRSLFVLVWNSRRGWRTGGQVEAWLEAISNAAPNAPIVIVATHCRDSVADLDEADVRRRFPRVVDIVQVDCQDGLGIEQLRAAIAAHARTLPLMGVQWPGSWCRGAEALAAEPGRSITRRRAEAILEESGVPTPATRTALLRALHDRGEILHFPNDPLLREHVILQPTWVDSMITRILDSQELADRGGVLSRRLRDELWHDIDNPGLVEMLTAMMERFDLAYRIDAPGHEDVALVVERLPAGAPPELSQTWANALEVSDARELSISYKLASRQAGVPSWFIAREHRFTTDTAWSGGVLLHHHGALAPSTALLTDDGQAQPTVRLAVRGAEPHTFLSILNEGFTGILAERYPGMQVRCMVPCPCGGETADGTCTYEFEYSAAQRMLTRGKSLQCNDSGEPVDPAALLLGLRTVPLKETLAQMQRTLGELVQTTGRVERNQLLVLDSVRDLLQKRGEQPDRCPGIFTLTKKGHVHRAYELQLFCEQPDQPHPLLDGAGVYRLPAVPAWMRRYAPYLRTMLTGLCLAMPLVSPILGVAGAVTLPTRSDSGIELTCQLLEDLPEFPDLDATGLRRASSLPDGAGPDFRELRAALLELDPDFGGLRERELPESRGIAYLCARHRAELRYPSTAAEPESEPAL